MDEANPAQFSGKSNLLFGVIRFFAKLLKKLRLYGLFFRLLHQLNLYSPVFYLIEDIQFETAKRKKEQARLISFYRQFVQPGDTCFDIGANLGTRVAAFRALQANVIAVEPQQFCMAYLQRKYRSQEGVVLVQKALAEREGTMEMLIANEHRYSSLSPDYVNYWESHSPDSVAKRWERTQTVEVTTLDKLIEAYGQPRFCKIDVEGFEEEVLKGLTQPIDVISFEYHSFRHQQALDCVDKILALDPNYTFNYSEGNTMQWGLSQWVDGARIKDVITAELSHKKRAGDIYACRPASSSI